MAEAGEEWTTIAKTKGKKKTKPEDEWQEVGSAKKDRKRKESAASTPGTSTPQQAAPQQSHSQGGGRGRGRGDGGGGRGRGDRNGGRGGGGYQGGGGTLPRKDSRGGGRPPPGTPRGGGLNHYGGRGAHTPSPGPGARSNTPGSATPVRATPPPPNPGPALQGAWAVKNSTPSSLEATPPPVENAWGVKKSSSQEPPPPQPSEQSMHPPTSGSDIAPQEKVAAKPVEEVETVKMGEQVSDGKELASGNLKVENVATVVKDEELTPIEANLDDAASVPKRLDTVAISREDASDMLTKEDKSDISLEKVMEEVKSSDNVTKEEEEKEQTVIKKESAELSVMEVSVADSNGNFPSDAKENITEKSNEAPPEKANVGDRTTEIKNNVVSNLHMMEEAAAEDGDVKPLTNGIDKEEPKGLPYTPEQWAPNNPDGKKQYERDFLLQLQRNPLSLKKPDAMPTNMEIIRDEVHEDRLRHVASAPNMSDFTPNYITGRTSNRGTPNRRDSRQQPKSAAAARLQGVKVITLPREEVKLKEAENAWKPTVKSDTKGKEESVDEVEALAKRVRSILNKLCPQKFDTLVNQFMELPIDNMDKMIKATDLVFEKALDEPAFAVAYARMCKTLGMRKITSVEEGKEVNFRTLLLTRCQREFQKDYMADLDRTTYVEKLSKATTEDEKKEINAEFSAQETKLRRRSLGNIKFIGELYRIQMLNGRIMHEIIQKLLRETDEESLECMCRLITTVGKILDEETKKLLASNKPPAGYFSLDSYFTSIKKLITDKVSTARIRFLMQDVLELRTANWVARREEAGPKTIEQIHKDAAMDAMKKSLEAADTGPPPSRRSEDRSDRRRSQARPPPKEKPVNQDGWNNVPDRPARMSQGKIDVNKLPRKVDASQMQFGPPGGMRPNWGRGSQQIQKKTSVQVQPTNRFAMFDVDDDGGVSAPPQPQYHGRASEPVISRSYGGRNSREGSKSREGSMGRRDSREGSYAGRHSNTEASRPNREASVPEAEVVSCLRGSSDASVDHLETKTRAILEEFFGLADLAEAFLCITELYHPQTIQSFFENMFNCVVERSSSDRIAAGRLTSHLLEREAMSVKAFLEGVSAIVEVAEDLAIDIPKFWSYIGEILAPSLLSRNAPLTLLRDSSKSLPSHLVLRYLGQALGAMVRADPSRAEETWKSSGLTFADFQVLDIKEFCSEYGLLALMPPPESPMASLKSRLKTAAHSPDSSFSPIFDLITANFKDTKDNIFLRDLVAAVLEACLDGQKNLVTLDPVKLTRMAAVLKPYLDSQDREVQALYSLQALVHRLEHPNKLLHSIFDVLYEVELISEDAFLAWEESTEPGEQEGKGVALKSCTQFFQWLKEAEPEDDPEDSEKAALLDLEVNSDLKASLRELHITAAKEVLRALLAIVRPLIQCGVPQFGLGFDPQVECSGGKKAIVVFVPVPQLKAFQKIQTRLVRELEKKFSGKHVVFVAQRRILPKPTRKANKLKQKRPRSRTLMAVHTAILDDLVYPAEIVGKRIRIRLDGTRLFKVHLDKTQQTNIEHKTETFSSVYKKLTGKEVNFEFPEMAL